MPGIALLFLIAPGLHRASAAPVIHSFTASDSSVVRGADVALAWDAAPGSGAHLNRVRINGDSLPVSTTSLIVTPLVTTTYTLSVRDSSGNTTTRASLVVSVTIDGNDDTATEYTGARARFVELVKNDADDTMFNVSEIEVFEFGVEPDGADPANDGTSTNDIVRHSSPAILTPPTTTQLFHGDANSVIDGDIESGAAVWTTAGNLGAKPRFMLDLGATRPVGKIRFFGRGDVCCPNRQSNFSVILYADDGAGHPGALVNRADFPGAAPAASQGHVEFNLALPNPGIRSFSVDKPAIPAGAPVTLSWEADPAATALAIDHGIGDVLPLTDANGRGSISLDPGPSSDTLYLMTATRPSGASKASVSVKITEKPIIDTFAASAASVPPGTTVTLTWDVSNATSLDLGGTDVTGLSQATVAPAATTTYTLRATNPDGAATRRLTIRALHPGEPVISEFLASNATGLADEDGEPSDWIELSNPTGDPAPLDGYFLTDDPAQPTKWPLPDLTLAPGGFLVVFASGKDRRDPAGELHANFSLSSDGEYLALVKPDGAAVVNEFAPKFPPQRTDVSFGFDETNARNSHFAEPTPGAANGQGAIGFVKDTSFSLDRGLYEAPIQVEIASATPGARIRYTLNGTKPTETTGFAYTGPVSLDKTTVLRAAAFKPGWLPTNTDTQTYIFPADVVARDNMRTSVTQDPVHGPKMIDSLKAIPTVSLVFDGDIERSEKPASVEFIGFENGGAQFDAGMERYGNYVTNFAKRSMRITFRSRYGPKKLSFPIFDGHDYPIPPSARIDSFELRSGNHDMYMRGAYLSNRFTDDTMLDMGNISPHGRFVHVYIDGIYWGQYHLRERWNAAMMSEYFGGGKQDYEAINANNRGSEFQTGVPFDGTGEHWQETQDLLASPAPFASVQNHLDVADEIDFMLLWVSGNSESEFRSAGGVPVGVPFKFFMKDADGFLRTPRHAVTHNGPLNAMTILRNEGNPDFNVLLADRIRKHFFDDGAFTPARNIARLQARIDETQLSFLAESARWGYRTPESWQSYQDNLVNNHLPNLTATMIQKFKNAGMYPDIEAPGFSQLGGPVPPGFQLTITAPAGTIHYTTDGTDPRGHQDPVNVPDPITLVPESAAKAVHVPTTATDGFADSSGHDWKETGFDDSSWTSGTGGVGYENSNGYQSYFSIDVGDEMHDKRTSCLIRIPFTVASGQLDGLNTATLSVRYDDGYVAYLNGTEIARKNFSGTPDGNSKASTNHSDGAAIIFEKVDVSSHLGLLHEGSNVLAIHGLNRSTDSSDFLVSAQLVVQETVSGGGDTAGPISPTAIEYTNPVPISSSTLVRSRVLMPDGNWSAMTEAEFAPALDALVVSEFMYHPPAPTPAEIEAGFLDADLFEYLEILNTGNDPLDLAGVRFTDGIDFDFTNATITTIAPGQRILIVKDRDAFEARYGTGTPIAGEFDGNLRNSGERVEFTDALGRSIRAFSYLDEDPWPPQADGDGPSLVLLDPASRPDPNNPANWTASDVPGGCPAHAPAATTTYQAWAAHHGAGAPDADDDHDDLSNFLEFMLCSDPHAHSPEAQPTGALTPFATETGTDDFLTITLTHNLAAENASLTVEVSDDMHTWHHGPGHTMLVSTLYHADGTATSTFRSESPVSANPRQFIRARFETTAP